MTVILDLTDESLTQVTTNTWTDKLTATGTLRPVKHKIFVSCEYSGTATNKVCAVRVLIDDVEVSTDAFIPAVANLPRKFCDMGLYHPTAGEHSIKLQVRSETTPQTTSIRRARIFIEQF